jgi:hypothetical protein
MHPFVEQELKHTAKLYDAQIERYVSFHLEQLRKTGASDGELEAHERLIRDELAEERSTRDLAIRSYAESEWTKALARFPFLKD